MAQHSSGGIDPALLEILLQDASLEGDQNKLNSALAMAEELRSKGNESLSDEGFMSGRVYVPPSVYQGGEKLMAAGRGSYQDFQNQQQQGNLAQATGQNRQALLAQLLRQSGGGGTPPIPGARPKLGGGTPGDPNVSLSGLGEY